MRDAAGEPADRLHLLHALQPDLIAGAPRLQLAGVGGQDRAPRGDAVERALDHGDEARDVLRADVVPGPAAQGPQHLVGVGGRVAGHDDHQRRRRRVVADALEQAVGEMVGMERADDQQITRRDAEQRHRIGRGDGVGDDRLETEARQAGQQAAAGRHRIVGEHDGKGARHRARGVRAPAGSRFSGNRHFPEAPESIGRRRTAPAGDAVRDRAAQAAPVRAFRRSASVLASPA